MNIKNFKRIANYNIKQNLAESLVLCKVDYESVLLASTPKYLIKQFQRVQNATVSFVLQTCTTEHDVISLDCLAVIERIEFNLAKMACESINSET